MRHLAATPVILLTAAIMAFGIYLPFSPVAKHLGLVHLVGRNLVELLRDDPTGQNDLHPAL